MINFFKKFKLLLILSIFFSLSYSVNAQNVRSYQYDLIDYKIQVNKDSTFDVTEDQTFDYIGKYNKGYRSIPYKDIGAITDVNVIDGETGQVLKYSPRALEKTDPASWGYFTDYNQNNALNIEWYYNLSNTTHRWIISYKVHGGIGFYNDHDEIYWNLFTAFDVPVKKITGLILPPEGNYDSKSITGFLYAPEINKTNFITIYDDKTVRINGSDFSPQDAVTVAVGWPKGVILKSSFWSDWYSLHWGDISSALVIILTFITLFIYWIFTEKIKQGRGNIVAEYDPPENLRPAMAELIVTERITKKSWPATVVDLAVRGYIKIDEEKQNFMDWTTGTLPKIILSVFFLAIAVFAFGTIFFPQNGLSSDSTFSNSFQFYTFMFVVIIIFGRVVLGAFKGGFVQKDYVLTSPKNYLDDQGLEPFEKQFITNLLGNIEGEFSTKKARRGGYTDLYQEMKDLADKLREETDSKTHAYSIPIAKQKIFNVFYFLIFVSFGLSFNTLIISKK